ncbi:MAG: DNA repair protein RadC [Nitrospirae bacterium]|nr:MAG: DNA repair protein RadC [Nitrospirota bacterium]
MKVSLKDKPHYHGHRERLRQRLLQGGINALKDYESLELLLTYAIPRKDTKPVAKALIERFGSLRGVFEADAEELLRVRGVGERTATFLKIVRTVFEYSLKEDVLKKPLFNSPDRVIEYLKLSLGADPNEQFRLLLLDNQNRLLREVTLSEGTVDQAHVYPRRVIEEALKHKASGLILVHNHPGGRESPSEADIKLTRKILNLASELNLRLLDHLIVTKNSYFSFKSEGLL